MDAAVYFGKLEPADSLLDYALFISLFPHLIAGPIQRPSHLLPQVQRHRSLKPDAFFDGCMLIVSGLFRKCVLADQCALIANAAFEGRMGRGFWATTLGTIAFAIQIYSDFSAYSDIARGSAQLLGFHFMVNFRQPYLATSLQDFWRRWHISLSTWLRDYLYIPLGGNRYGPWKTFRNLMATMLLGGLWHGANWTFVLWGGIHGLGLSAERLSGTVMFWGRRLLTFLVVCLAWIFFRAVSIGEAFRMLGDLSIWNWRAGTATGRFSRSRRSAPFHFAWIFGSSITARSISSRKWRSASSRRRDFAIGPVWGGRDFCLRLKLKCLYLSSRLVR